VTGNRRFEASVHGPDRLLNTRAQGFALAEAEQLELLEPPKQNVAFG
jgi:hypothetical protein